MRFLLVMVVLAVFLACLAAMYWGWRNRARRQAALLPPFDPPPADLGTELRAAAGVYLGTTTAASWQDRVAVGGIGLRANATLHMYSEGVLADRQGGAPLWIPAAAIAGARTGRALAGKIVGSGGLLVIRWQHGDLALDTGFRADDPSAYQSWIDQLTRISGSVTA